MSEVDTGVVELENIAVKNGSQEAFAKQLQDSIFQAIQRLNQTEWSHRNYNHNSSMGQALDDVYRALEDAIRNFRDGCIQD